MANYYIREGATGADDGSNWNNAYPSLPSVLERGSTYYIADGNYAGYTFNDAESGTTLITIKKATVADHGTETGWNNTYGDGQAHFGDFIFVTDYHYINGVSRNESDWNDVASYGIYIRSVFAINLDADVAGDNISFLYCDIGFPYNETFQSGMYMALGCAGFSQTISNWTISRCCLHNSIGTIIGFSGITNGVVEYCWIGPGWGKEAIRGSVETTNCIIRYNIFWQSVAIDPEDGTSGITAEIAIWDGDNFDNNEIYGNVFYNNKSGGRNAVIQVGGDNGVGWAGPPAHNTKVYNNTFAGLAEDSVFGEINLLGNNTEGKNNLFYDCIDSDVNADSVGGNVTSSNNPFIDYNNYDFRIVSNTGGTYPRNAGVDLGVSYNTDLLGNTRGQDGTWDVGAYEFSENETPPTLLLLPPIGRFLSLRV